MKALHIFTASALLFTSTLFADAKATAKAEIGKQFALLKKGDTVALKARFTDRQKERVTADKVKKLSKKSKSIRSTIWSNQPLNANTREKRRSKSR